MGEGRDCNILRARPMTPRPVQHGERVGVLDRHSSLGSTRWSVEAFSPTDKGVLAVVGRTLAHDALPNLGFLALNAPAVDCTTLLI